MQLLQTSAALTFMIMLTLAFRIVAWKRLPKRIFPLLWDVIILRALLFMPLSLTLPIPGYPKQERVRGFLQNIWPYNLSSFMRYSIKFSSSILIKSVWLGVAIALLLFFSLLYFRYSQKCKMSIPTKDGFSKIWLTLYGKKHNISINVSDRIQGPLCYGLLKPVILMPKSFNWENTAHLRDIYIHEYMHICYGDLFVKLALVLVVCIYWYNPLIWVVFKIANLDMELACDERVLETLGTHSKKAYAQTLMDMAKAGSETSFLYTHFSNNFLEKRIISIMAYNNHKMIKKLFSMTVLLIMCFICIISL